MKKVFHVLVCVVTAALILFSLGASPVIKGAYPYFDLTAFNGIATGSLPSCAAGVAAGEGWFAYDSTTKTMKYCNGTSWSGVADFSSIGQSLIPSADNTYDIGTAAKTWKVLYLHDTINDAFNGKVRLNVTTSQPNIYYGDASDGAGAIANKMANEQAITASDTRYVIKYYRDNATTAVANIDTNGNFRNDATGFTSPMVHGTSGTTAKDMEVGVGAMTAGALTVTFTTQFGGNPSCVCSHVNATPLPCGISTGPSTTGVVFSVATGGTDVVDWHCVGTR